MSHLIAPRALAELRHGNSHVYVCLSQGWVSKGLMMVEVLELDFQGWKCGDIGKRQGEPQDKDTEVGGFEA